MIGMDRERKSGKSLLAAQLDCFLVFWGRGVYGILTFVGYLMPNSFL